MKRILFCAAIMAAMSMVFVACGKKDNANTENEGAQLSFEDSLELKMQELHDILLRYSDREEIVKDIEVAVKEKNYTKAKQLLAFAAVTRLYTDFTEEQKSRLIEARDQIPEEFLNQYSDEESLE